MLQGSMPQKCVPQKNAAELAELLGAKYVGEKPAHELVIEGVADLESADPLQVSFLANSRYSQKAKDSKAGLIIVASEQEIQPGRSYLIHIDPSKAFQRLIELFCGDLRKSGFTGQHPTAIVHATARVDPTATLSPYAVIDAGVVIKARAFVGAFVYIGPDSIIGEDTVLHPHAVVRERSILHSRVILQPGAVVGSCGYGYSTSAQGVHEKLEQVGNVELDEDVEVGANTTIDRARFRTTRVGRGTKIDNLVQVAHNVLIGKHCLIISQVGIAGSTKIGDYVVLAGKVAVNGHITICNQVMVAACSAVSKSISVPGKYSGVPAIEIGKHNRQAVLLRNIERFVLELKALKKGECHSLNIK